MCSFGTSKVCQCLGLSGALADGAGLISLVFNVFFAFGGLEGAAQ